MRVSQILRLYVTKDISVYFETWQHHNNAIMTVWSIKNIPIYKLCSIYFNHVSITFCRFWNLNKNSESGTDIFLLFLKSP